MLREMTSDEKLNYSAEILEALRRGGFSASLEVVKKYEKLLSNDNISKEVPKAKAPEPLNAPVGYVLSSKVISDNEPKVASIYAEEHIPAVQQDLMEQGQNINASETLAQHKTKILRNQVIPQSAQKSIETPTKPNPWSDAKTVAPGEIKGILTR